MNLQQLDQAVRTGQIKFLDNYPEMIRQQLEQGNLSIEQAETANALGRKELSWYDKNAQANLNATNRSNRGSGGSTSKTASKTALKEQINYLQK